MENTEGLESLRFRLLNEYQKNFPICERPFAAIASELQVSEQKVLEEYETLLRDGLISRIGAVIAPNRIGVSTLAAIQVPPERLGEVAGIINSFNEVNHNYEREAELNLWFVVNASTPEHFESVLAAMEKKTGLKVHDLRLEEEFRIDLGFDLKPHGLSVEKSL